MFQCVECMSLIDNVDRFAPASEPPSVGRCPRTPRPILVDRPVSCARRLYGLQGQLAEVSAPMPQARADAVTPPALPVTSVPASQIEVCSEGGQATRARP